MVATSYILKYATLFSLGTTVLSKPVKRDQPVAVVNPSSTSFQSFDNFGGISSLSNFDQFFGVDNFDGSFNQQTIVVEQQQQVCSNVEINLIQQRLTIMREFVKRILLEQVCEVETQVVVLSQFSSGIDSFSRDLRRQSGRDVIFDATISSQLTQLLDENGVLTSNDLGFLGSQVGTNGIRVSGSNWEDATSPASVGSVYQAAMSARGAAQNSNATEPARTTTASVESKTVSQPTASASAKSKSDSKM